ncbi:MAG TPA: HAMP domain-containing sensor histidine kinase [Thermoplasmata archaeon]|nr:HAMP domain-containing sensor histidine kinase [Thermoplasmata archaeon]
MDKLIDSVMHSISDLFGITEMVCEILAEDIRPVFRNAVYGYPEENAKEIIGTLRAGYYPKDLAEKILCEKNHVSKYGYYMSAEEWHRLVESEPCSDHPAYYKHPDQVYAPRKSADEWHESDSYPFGLRDTTGELIGWLDLSYSKYGKLLDNRTLSKIDLFVEQAAIALQRLRADLRLRGTESKRIQRTELLEDVLHIASAVISERDIKKLSDMMLSSVASLFGFRKVSLVVYDETDGVFRFMALYGYDESATQESRFRTIPTDAILEDLSESKRIGASVYFTKEETSSPNQLNHFVRRPSREDLVAKTPRKKDEFRQHDSLAFALHDASGRIVGVIYPSEPSDGMLPDKETIETIGIFTSLAEVAIENARLSADREEAFRISSQRTEQLSRILDMTSGIMYVRDLDQMLDNLLKTVAHVTGIKRMTIGVRHEDEGFFKVEATYGYSPKTSEEIKKSTYPTTQLDAILNGGPSIPQIPLIRWRKKVGRMTFYMPAESVNVYPEDLIYYPEPELIRLPRKGKGYWHEMDYMDTFILDSRGEMLAYLETLKPRDDHIPDAEVIEIVEIFASLAGIAIENSRNFQSHVDSRRNAELYTDLLSHDIKNYNQAMLGYLELLRSKLKEPEHLTLIDKISEQVVNTGWLATNVRTMSRVTFGDVELVRTDLGAVLLQCNTSVAQYFPSRRITFLGDVQPNRHFAYADELVRELFINILTNAVKYDPSGVVEIDISVDRVFVNDRKLWAISIADRGRGIPDDMKEVIFDRFSKAAKKKGSGLGLHIVRALAKRYGGSVTVEDRVKGDHTKGAVFKVLLPATE